MNYILKKICVNGNTDRFGGSDTEREIAISDDAQKLEDYCQETYGKPTKKDGDEFVWEYYVIEPTTMIFVR